MGELEYHEQGLVLCKEVSDMCTVEGVGSGNETIKKDIYVSIMTDQ